MPRLWAQYYKGSERMNLDTKGREITGSNPNLIVPWFLMASYLYYHTNQSLLSDEYYDELSKELLSRWDQVEHRHKYLITKDDLIAGSLFTLNEKNYPEMCKGAALVLAAELGNMSRIEAKLAKAVEALQDIFEKPRSADWTYAELISEMNKEAREALAEIKGETT